MGLIRDQQEKNAKTNKPVIKPLPAVKPANIEQELQQVSSSSPPPPVAPQTTSAPPIVEPTPQQTGQFPDASTEELPQLSQPEAPQVPADNLLPDEFTPSVLPQTPYVPPTLTPVAPIWSDINEAQSNTTLNPYSFSVVNTQLPTLYDAPPSISPSITQAAKYLQDDQTLREYAAANAQQEQTQTRAVNPNVPEAEKTWQQAATQWLADLTFGSDKARQSAEQGIFDPLASFRVEDIPRAVLNPGLLIGRLTNSSFGRAGGGAVGGASYALGLPFNLGTAALAETNKLRVGFLRQLGVEQKKAEEIVGNGLRTLIPDSFIGFNYGAAKKGNLISGALLGDTVADFNDPKESGDKVPGRVYYDPGRKVGQNWWERPLNAGFEGFIQLANPFDRAVEKRIGQLINTGFANIFGGKTAVTPLPPQQAPKKFLSLPSFETLERGRVLGSPETKEAQRAARELRNRVLITEPPAQRALPFTARRADGSIVAEGGADRKLLPAATPQRVDESIVPYQRTGELSTNQLPPIYANEEFAKRTLITPPPGQSSAFSDNVLTTPPPSPVYSPFGKAPIGNLNPYTPGNLPVLYDEFVATGDLAIRNDLPPLVRDYTRKDGDISPGFVGGQFTDSPSSGELAKIYYDAEFVDEAFAATTPTKVTRAYVGETTVNQNAIVELIDIRTIPPRQRYLIPTSNPTNLMLNVGIGEASSVRLAEAGDIFIRTLSQIVENIKIVAPEIADSFKGINWDDLKLHIQRVAPGLDISQFNAIGSKLPDIVDNVKAAALFTGRAVQAADIPGKVRAAGEVVGKFATETKDNITKELEYTRNFNAQAAKAPEPEIKSVEFTPEGTKVEVKETEVPLVENGPVLSLSERVKLIDSTTNAKVESIKNNVDRRTPPAILTREIAAARFSGEAEKRALVNSFNNLKPPISNTPTLDDLLMAAKELAAHKLALDAPLKQLDELFESTIDFSRRNTGLGNYTRRTSDEVLQILTSGGNPNLIPGSYDSLPDALRLPLLNNDLDELISAAAKSGTDLDEVIRQATVENNRLLDNPFPINPTPPTKALVQAPTKFFHGSALKDWNPNYNISINGSRGELGSGLYLTDRQDIAADYALSRVGENAGQATLDIDIDPSVTEVSSALKYTLDANTKLPVSDSFFSGLVEGLPLGVLNKLLPILRKTKTNTYNSFLTKLETAIVKSKLEPTEELLQTIQNTVSNNLRKQGYDSVYDGKSGYFLALDGGALSIVEQRKLGQVKSPTDAALARYNADAYAAKYYSNRLTTDANLRDSTAKLLNQMQDAVDTKLAEVQKEIIRRDGQVDSVLPKLDPQPDEISRPQTVQELIDNIIKDDICNL